MRSTRILNLLSVAMIAAVLAGGLFFLCKPCRAMMLIAAGRARGCPVGEALQAPSHQDAAQERIAQASRVVREDPAGYEMWETPKGSYWMPKNDDRAQLPNILAEHERHIYGSGEQGVKAGDVVLDCGAHVGTFTREALAAGAKLVVAVEPSPKNAECVRRNFAPEIAAGRVILYQKGVWDSETTLTFHVDPSNAARDSVYVNPRVRPIDVQVPVTTIDKLAAELGLARVDFIKMDIEGAEPKALAGARATLARHHPRLAICVYHASDDPVNVPLEARRGWSGYRVKNGPCEDEGLRLFSQTLLFY